MSNPLHEVQKLSQSIWYDNIKRSLIDDGTIGKMIQEGNIVGITSNPSIFEKAIAGSTDYDKAIKDILEQNPETTVSQLYEQLITRDICDAADLLKPVYEKSAGLDGYVSVEVSPELAYNTEDTIAEGLRLFENIGRPNVMIKVPATKEGLPAITALIGKGINVNVTLMFSMQDFLNVADAYLSGLEKLQKENGDLSKVSSVASFFISRMDTAVDKLLPENSPLLGKTAISYAKNVYKRFEQELAESRFQQLKKNGARVQRLLWASTSVKNPKYRDVLYVEELIGPNTVNTVPPATLDAFADHGKASVRVTKDLEEVAHVLKEIKNAQIDLDEITAKLQQQGVEAFANSFTSLMNTLKEKHQAIVTQLNYQTK